MTRTTTGWLAWLGRWQRRYLAADGGAGAHLLAVLAGHDPRLQRVSSPRHADLLLLIEPISQKLAASVAEVARAMPRPAQVLVVDQSGREHVPGADLARVEELLPGARRVTRASAAQILAAALDRTGWSELAVARELALELSTLPLPPKREREIATELAVLSLGPIQPFTAGPLRLLLICDGEQVLNAEIEAGYAHRGITEAMCNATWHDCANLAAQLDPLAPVAGYLAYLRALEQVQGRQPPSDIIERREAALALERAQNHLWWLVRFARLLAFAPLAEQAHHLASTLADSACAQAQLLDIAAGSAARDAAPTRSRRPNAHPNLLRWLADNVAALGKQVERDQLLGLRTRGIGVLEAEHLAEAGVSGPVLLASEQGAGDVQSRIVTRLCAAVTDLCRVAEAPAAIDADGYAVQGSVPQGEAHARVDGPRGRIDLHVVSAGGEGPAQVQWQRPSAALLPLLPEVLAEQKLADAEIILASLDLAMAEADG